MQVPLTCDCFLWVQAFQDLQLLFTGSGNCSRGDLAHSLSLLCHQHWAQWWRAQVLQLCQTFWSLQWKLTEWHWNVKFSCFYRKVLASSTLLAHDWSVWLNGDHWLADRESKKLGQGVFKPVFVHDLQNRNPKWPSPFGSWKLNSVTSFTLGITNIKFWDVLHLGK